jgi:hypothetical protein
VAREHQVAQATALLAETPDGLSGRERARRLIDVVEGIDSLGKARTLCDLVESRLAVAAGGQRQPDAVNASTTGRRSG